MRIWLLTLVLVLGCTGCGLIMLPMICDAPGSCGQQPPAKYFDGASCLQNSDCASNFCSKTSYICRQEGDINAENHTDITNKSVS